VTNRVGHLRLLARLGFEKGRNRLDIIADQLNAEVTGSHDRHRLAQIPALRNVKIKRGQGDVPERWDLEDILVARGFCAAESAFSSPFKKRSNGALGVISVASNTAIAFCIGGYANAGR
jgi:hypothetical protein